VRLILYTGMGGVGKTTTAAATAALAAARGRRTLVASADAAHSLGDVFEQRLEPTPTSVAPNLDAIEIDARVEMLRRWGRIREFLVEMFEYQGVDAVVAEELALLPGAEEITTLLAVEEYAQAGGYEFVVVDCAPTDSTLRLVTLPDVASRFFRIMLPIVATISGVAVPLARRLVAAPLPDSGVFREADELIYRHLAALKKRISHRDTSVRMVVTPERMVIDEAQRAYTDLALFEVGCDAVIMNRMLPEAASDEEFFADWCRLQGERFLDVERLFAPLPVLRAPLAEDEVCGVDALRAHGKLIFGGIAPESRLCNAPRIQFVREGQEYIAIVPLPNVDPGEIDVVKIDDELSITTGSRRRSLKLPRRFVPLSLTSARLEGRAMRVSFAGEAARPEGV
jgi:arsenite-transporting ATPase